MNCSEAQLLANRQNAALSTGPKTEAGKQIARGNAFKHGRAGNGVVVATENASQVETLAYELENQMRPVGPLGRILVRRLAVHANQLENSSLHDDACRVDRMARAEQNFDDARLADAEKMMAWITTAPATYCRRLQWTPEGMRLLLDTWQYLRDDLTDTNHEHWEYGHLQRVENLMGRQPEDYPSSRAKALSEAICGRPHLLDPGDAAGLDDLGRRQWAKDRMVEIIDERVAQLHLFDGIYNDPDALDARRAGARDRARFDPSHEAQLARRYDAANERAFFRTLREIRETGLAQVEASIEPQNPPQAPETPANPPELGSFGAEEPTEHERRRARPDPSTLLDKARERDLREARNRALSPPEGPA